jgi:hypothetical protein
MIKSKLSCFIIIGAVMSTMGEGFRPRPPEAATKPNKSDTQKGLKRYSMAEAELLTDLRISKIDSKSDDFDRPDLSSIGSMHSFIDEVANENLQKVQENKAKLNEAILKLNSSPKELQKYPTIKAKEAEIRNQRELFLKSDSSPAAQWLSQKNYER